MATKKPRRKRRMTEFERVILEAAEQLAKDEPSRFEVIQTKTGPKVVIRGKPH